MQRSYTIRTASVADAAVIAHHRAAMFHDMGLLDAKQIEELETASRVYFRAALARSEYLGWLAECEGRVIAGGGLSVRPLLPRPGFIASGEEAYVMNVYTEPEHRRLGVVLTIVERMLGWCRERRIPRISLHASDEGRSMYERLGFKPTNEMLLEQLDV